MELTQGEYHFTQQDYEYIAALEAMFSVLRGTELPSDLKESNISRAIDADGNIISGVLVCDTGIEGATSAIISATHMNELAGFAAQQAFLDAWKEGVRPASGKVYLMIGGDEYRVAEAFAMIEESKESGRLKAAEYNGLRITGDAYRYNYNRLPPELLVTPPEQVVTDNPHDERHVQLLPLLNETEGRVIDIHTMSNHGKAMLIPTLKEKDAFDAPARSVSSHQALDILQYATDEKPALQDIIADIPADYILSDANYFAKTRLLPITQTASIPLTYEAGGAHLDPACGALAVEATLQWLENVHDRWMEKEKLQQLLPEWYPYAVSCKDKPLTEYILLTDIAPVYPPAHPDAVVAPSLSWHGIMPEEDVYLIVQDKTEMEALFTGGDVNKARIAELIEANCKTRPDVKEKLHQALVESDDIPLQGITKIRQSLARIRHGNAGDAQALMVENFQPYPPEHTIAIGLFTGHEVRAAEKDQAESRSYVQKYCSRQPENERILTMLPQTSHFGVDMREALCFSHKATAFTKGKDIIPVPEVRAEQQTLLSA